MDFSIDTKMEPTRNTFFSKIDLINSDIKISIAAYLVFAIAYIIAFSFIIFGLYQLKESIKLFSNNNVFQKSISEMFLKAGRSFFLFAFGTFAIDITLLAYTLTGSRVIDLMSTELIVFTILGYLMFFLSDVFKQGIIIKEENDLTI